MHHLCTPTTIAIVAGILRPGVLWRQAMKTHDPYVPNNFAQNIERSLLKHFKILSLFLLHWWLALSADKFDTRNIFETRAINSISCTPFRTFHSLMGRMQIEQHLFPWLCRNYYSFIIEKKYLSIERKFLMLKYGCTGLETRHISSGNESGESFDNFYVTLTYFCPPLRFCNQFLPSWWRCRTMQWKLRATTCCENNVRWPKP